MSGNPYMMGGPINLTNPGLIPIGNNQALLMRTAPMINQINNLAPLNQLLANPNQMYANNIGAFSNMNGFNTPPGPNPNQMYANNIGTFSNMDGFNTPPGPNPNQMYANNIGAFSNMDGFNTPPGPNPNQMYANNIGTFSNMDGFNTPPGPNPNQMYANNIGTFSNMDGFNTPPGPNPNQMYANNIGAFSNMDGFNTPPGAGPHGPFLNWLNGLMSTVYQAAASGAPMPGGGATPPAANDTQQAPDTPAATDEAEGADEAETGDATSSNSVSNPHEEKAKEITEAEQRLANEANQLTANPETFGQQQQLRLVELQAEQNRLNEEKKKLQLAMLSDAQKRVADTLQQLAAQDPKTPAEAQVRDQRVNQLQGIQNQLSSAEQQIQNGTQGLGAPANSRTGNGQLPSSGPSSAQPATPNRGAQAAQAPNSGAQQSPFRNITSNPQQLRNFSDEARKQHDAQRMRYFIALQLMLQQAQQFADEAEAMERQTNGGQAATPSQVQQPVAPQAPVQPQPQVQQPVAPQAPVQPQPQVQQPVAPQAPVQPQPQVQQPMAPQAPVQPQPQAQQPVAPQAPVQPQPQAQQPVAPIQPQAAADTTAADEAEAAKRAQEAERIKALEAENKAYKRQVLKDKATTLYNASRGYYGKSQKDFNAIMSGLSPQERAEINTLYSEVARERSRGRNTNTLEQDLLANKPYWSGYSTMTDLNQTQQHLLMSSLHGNNPQEQARVMRDTLMPDGNGWWRWKQTQKAIDHAVKGMSDQQFGQFINAYGAQNFVNDMLKIQGYSYLDQSDINAHLTRARQYQ